MEVLLRDFGQVGGCAFETGPNSTFVSDSGWCAIAARFDAVSTNSDACFFEFAWIVVDLTSGNIVLRNKAASQT